ncbi:MAG: methyltransferase domain-containing protein [Deltaproteobacteria bacterium]|nr:methyltransferase domain-containing protein [Deltaproteobacteria bacterium]
MDKGWTSEEVRRLAGAYWSSCALHAGVQTGVTTFLAQKGPATAADLATHLGLDPRATGMLCTALLALKAVSLADGTYTLAPDLAPLLDPEAPQSLANSILHLADMVPDWGRLAQCVTTGRPVPEEEEDPGAGQQNRAHFYRAMRDLARGQAPGLAAVLGLRAGMRVLDLGGGPGVYGLNFAAETPGLDVTIFDLPQAEQFFRQEAARLPAAHGVKFLAGDFTDTPLGGPYDLIWLSQVLHGQGPESCQKLLNKAVAALARGGMIYIQEFVLDRENPVPPWPALFSLNMLINTPHGQSYSAGELTGFLSRTGLCRAEHLGPTRPGSPAGLVRGVRE